jgi:anti-sigma factor RsiW
MTDHVDPETLYLLSEGSLDDETARGVREHLAHCGACQAEAAMVESFAAASTEPADADVEQRLRASVLGRSAPRRARPRRPRPMPRWAMGGLLAATVAVIAVGIWQMQPDDLTSRGHLRGTTSAGSWALRVSRVQEGWSLNWAAQPGAESYLVRVQSPTGETVWSESVDTTALRIDERDVGVVEGSEAIFFVSILCMVNHEEIISPPVRLPATP